MKIFLVGARNIELLTSFDAQNIFTRGPWLDLFHKRRIDENGAVNTNEPVRAEFLGDGGHGLTKKICAGHPTEQYVIALRFYSDNIGRINEENSAFGLDRDPGRLCQHSFQLRKKVLHARWISFKHGVDPLLALRRLEAARHRRRPGYRRNS